ncbi:MAG: hypothetical protein RJB34_1272 [Pseudomonadota bacterium]|jgi:nucleoside-diphosphate-sugar epimerase
MKIFLTGGTGFIGSHFINQASVRGHTIIAQRRPGSCPRIMLPIQPIWLDRALDADFTAELGACDVLVHLASHTPNPPYATLDECLYWNVYATTKIIQQADQAGLKKFIIAGSCFEYGRAAIGHDFVHPASQLAPTLSYPISKAAASISLLGLARQQNLQMQLLRIFQVFGEGEAASRFWPSLKAAAIAGKDFHMSQGLQIRDFINVEDVACKFVDALDFDAVCLGRPVVRNVGTGVGMTLLEFAEYWWGKFGATGKLVPGQIPEREIEIRRLVANITETYVN